MHPLAPLLILFTILGVLGFIGYAVYTISNDIADKTSKKMQKKNILVTKDGMKVGVKEVKEESYVDTTQRYVSVPTFSPLHRVFGETHDAIWGKASLGGFRERDRHGHLESFSRPCSTKLLRRREVR